MTGGTLRVRALLSGVKKSGEAWQEKVSQIRLYSGAKFASADEAAAGSVCAVTGLNATYAGEGLGAEVDADAPALMSEGHYIKSGYNEELDKLREAARRQNASITEYLAAVLIHVLLEKQHREHPHRERPVALAIPITIASSMVSIITLIDTSLVQGQLQNALGYSLDETRALYGNYSACMDLYNLPSSLMVALTASVIPAVSASITQHNEKQTARIVRSSFRVTALLAFPMGLGLWSLSGPIFRLFYPRYAGALGGHLLSVLGIASIFVCLMLITNSILQSYGRVNVPIFTMLIGGVVKIVLNYNLTAVPSINIHGAPIGTLVCFALTAILNLIAVSRVAAFHLNYPGYFLRPLLASLAMAFSARGVYALCAHFLLSEDSGRTIMLVCVGAAIAVAVVVYAVLVLALRIVTRDDLALLPKGEKLARILHVR